ncbi:MAG: hypothetical protein GC160_08085 [Acidobacteria bacterium]|nr:hypothetical protein [Acidobacteriota bacterium]
MRYFLSLLLTLCALPLTAPAADLLFAFDGDAAVARVYDAATLTLLSTPQVPAGARFAVGRPAPSGSGFDRIYLIGDGGVEVLDGAFQSLGSIAVEGSPAPLQPAALSADGRFLVLAAGSKAYRIDTSDGSIDTIAETGRDLAGVALPADSGYAFLLASDRRTVFRMNVSTGALDGPTTALPAFVQALQAGRATAEGGLAGFDLGKLSDAFFAAGERPSRVVGTRSAASGLAEPSAASPDGRVEWRMAGNGSLQRVDVTGQTAALETPSAGTTALALLSGPVVEQTGPQLEKVGGDGQIVLAGNPFTLQVQGSGGVIGGLPLGVSVSPSLATCNAPALSGVTTINCTASVSVPASTQVSITVSGLGNPVVFSVVVVPQGLSDSLSIVAGNNQNVATGASFSLSVRSVKGGVPFSGGTISVASISPGVATCPTSRTASLLGEATFDCTADFVSVFTPVTIQLTDGANVANFQLNVIAGGGPSGGLAKVSADPSTAAEGTSFTLTVEAKIDGTPQVGLQVNVNAASAAITCPANATTNQSGQAAIICQANQVNQDTTTTVTVSEGGRSVTFTVTVANQDQSDGLRIVSGNGQIVTQNTQFPQPLVVSARINGVPQNGLKLTVQSSNNAVFCTDQLLTDENGLGQIVCNAGAVSSFTTVQILVSDDNGRVLPEPFTATVSPTPVGIATDIELLTTGPLIGTVGEEAPTGIRVRAVNDSNEPVPGATIFFRSSADLSFSPAVVTSNVSGEAVTTVTFGCPSRTGTIQIGLTAVSTEATLDFQANNGPLAQLQVLQGDGQSGSPGVRMGQALLVRTADVCGNPVPNTAVAWGVNPPEAAALEVVGQVSNGQGQASALVRPTARGGPFQVLVAAQSDSSIQATFNLTVTNIPTFFRSVSGNAQTVAAGAVTAEPVVVEVLNEQSQPVAGVNVSFSVLEGGVTIESQTGATNAMGRSSAFIRAGSTLGPAKVRATALGLAVDFLVSVLGAQPVLTTDGFVNAASFRPGLSPGSAASIFAVNITGDVQGIAATPYDPASGFPTVFRGVQVLVNGVAAPILALVNINGQEQVNIQVPFQTSGNFATVTVINNSSQSSIPGVPVFSPQPGIFEVTDTGGSRFAAALHVDYSLVSPTNPARPGEAVQLFLTGMGRLEPAVATNVAGPVPPALTVADPTVTLDGTVQEVLGSFYAPQLISVYQVNFIVGAAAQPGNRALQVELSGVGSKIVVLPVGAAQ